MVDFVDKYIYQQLATQLSQDLLQQYPKGNFLITDQLQDNNIFDHITVIFCNVDFNNINRWLTSDQIQQKYLDLFSGSFKFVAVNCEQIDLFMTYCYHSYYCGYLLKNIAQSFDVDLTQTGLYRKGSSGDIQRISNSWLKILECFDYSFNTWNKGFKTTEEMFNFLTTSRFFFPNLHHNSNNVSHWSSPYELSRFNQFKSWLLQTYSGELPTSPSQEIKERFYIRIDDTFPHLTRE